MSPLQLANSTTQRLLREMGALARQLATTTLLIVGVISAFKLVRWSCLRDVVCPLQPCKPLNYSAHEDQRDPVPKLQHMMQIRTGSCSCQIDGPPSRSQNSVAQQVKRLQNGTRILTGFNRYRTSGARRTELWFAVLGIHVFSNCTLIFSARNLAWGSNLTLTNMSTP